MVFIVFTLLCVGLAGLIRGLMAIYTPDAHAKLVAEENRRRELRNATAKKGFGLAMKFMGK